jgi:hypothetical protein
MSESNPFITANDRPISIEQALRYLKSAGKLESVLWEIVLQYVIEKELEAVAELEINSELIDQTILEFRMAYQSVGYDASKRIKGRKRFMSVDTLGLEPALRVLVTATSVGEREGGKQVLHFSTS